MHIFIVIHIFYYFPNWCWIGIDRCEIYIDEQVSYSHIRWESEWVTMNVIKHKTKPCSNHDITEQQRYILEIDRYIGRYLGFTDISVSANSIGLNTSWQNAVIFLTHPDNLRKKAQQSKSSQLPYNNASRCGFIKKQTRLTKKHASVVTTKTKASSESFAMLESTTCRCCVRINSHCTSGSFSSTKSLTGT